MTKSADISLGRETLISFVAKVVHAVIGFAGIIIFYRLLGPTTVGRYYTILAGVILTGQVTNGVYNAIRKRVSEAKTSISTYLGVGFITWVLQLPLAVLGAVVVLKFIGEITPRGVALTVVMVLSHTLFTLINRVYAASHPGSSMWVDTVRSLLTFAFQVGLILNGFGVVGLMTGYFAAAFISALGVWIKLGVVPSVPSRQAFERVYEFARWSVPTTFTVDLYRRLDVLILSALVGSTAVGLYEPALRLTVPATFVSMSVGTSLTVKASGLSSLGRGVVEDTKNALSYTSLLAIPLFFGAVSIAEPLMRTVYGPSATAGTVALVGLALFQVFNSFRIPFESVFDGINRPDLRFYVSVLAVIVNIPGAIYLGLRFGLEGVVAATILAEGVRVLALQVLAYRLFDDFMITRSVVEQVFSGLAMYLVVEAVLASGFTIHSWTSLIAILAVGGATYFVVLAAISQHFKQTVRNTLGQFAPST